MSKFFKSKLFYVIFYLSALIGAFIKRPIYGIIIIIGTTLWAAYVNKAFIYSFIANVKYNKGDIEGTMAWYDKCIKLNSCSPRTKITYAYLLLKFSKVEKCQSLLKQIEKLNLNEQDEAQFKMTYALFKWKTGALNEGIDILEEVYNKFKSTVIYETLGYLLIIDENYEKALKINLEAFEYNSDDNVIVDNLGETYIHLGDFEKAKELYEKLIPKNPNFSGPYFNYGLVLKENGNKEEARKMFEKALTFKESFLSNLTHERIQSEIDSL